MSCSQARNILANVEGGQKIKDHNDFSYAVRREREQTERDNHIFAFRASPN